MITIYVGLWQVFFFRRGRRREVEGGGVSGRELREGRREKKVGGVEGGVSGKVFERGEKEVGRDLTPPHTIPDGSSAFLRPFFR